MKSKKILIVGTQPYNQANQARAFDSYFHNFSPENLIHIFSDARTPCKGHCESLYQIKDIDLLKKVFFPWHKVGRIFKRNSLKDFWSKDDAINPYKPKKRGPLSYWLRRFLWRRLYWDSEKLETLVKDFRPDIVFISFSYDFFILNIGEYFSRKYQIPIIISIADDLIFRGPMPGFLGKAYHRAYVKRFKKLISRNRVFAIYESNKMKNKYESELNLKGEIVYIASSLIPKANDGITFDKNFRYFGNLEFGRLDSLIDIAKGLEGEKISSCLEIYSSDYCHVDKSKLPATMRIFPPVPYSEVIQLMNDSSFLVIVESFEKANVDAVKYSLSTKIADSLCSGIPILAYGASGTGAIDFLKDNQCAFVADSKEQLQLFFSKFRNRSIDYLPIAKKQFETAKRCFSVNEQASYFFEIANKLN